MNDETTNLLPVLRQAASARAYASVAVQTATGDDVLAICDGRLLLDDGDEDGSATIARLAALIEQEHCVAVLEPLLDRPAAHRSEALDTNAAIREAVRQMAITSQLRRGIEPGGETSINLSEEERRPNALADDDGSSDDAARRAQADRMREEFFARRRSLHRSTGGGAPYRASIAGSRTATPARNERGVEPSRPGRELMDQVERSLVLTPPEDRPTTRRRHDDPPPSVSSPTAPEGTTVRASEPDQVADHTAATNAVTGDGEPTRRGALRSLIRSLVE